MLPKLNRPCTAFAGEQLIATGEVREVAEQIKDFLKTHRKVDILVFDDQTSELFELDLRGSSEAVQKRLEALALAEAPKSGPGRPKLGVVSKEVTLLPQHWEWLSSQPGGASVTLRKLVEEARRQHRGRDEKRQAQEATYRFMTVMAGDLPQYEEALRLLYSKNQEAFLSIVQTWPEGIGRHLKKISQLAFDQTSPSRASE